MSYIQEIPQYDFNHLVFKVERKFIGWAKEHQIIAALHSNVIRWEVVQTITPLHIPTVYHIHYLFNSITGLNVDAQPVYGKHHILEIALPVNYPIQPSVIRMVTDVWHPNIRSDGPSKGHVCSNARNLGKMFDLYQLVLRIGEILQYKNYHAENTPPFPEDSGVANWVLTVAEPQGIVNKHRNIFVDDTPLIIDPLEEAALPEPEKTAQENTPLVTAPLPSQADAMPEQKRKMIIKGITRNTEETPPGRQKITFNKKNPE